MSLKSLNPECNKAAFTLAEVLVTLGIIGVISAMTVPSLMQNYQRQSYVTQLSKVYNEFQQAFLQYKTDKNAIDLIEGGLISNNTITSFMSKYFKVVTSCPDFMPCFADSYRNINGTTIANRANYWGAGGTAPCFALASGASVCVEYANQHNLSIGGVSSPYGHITIDVNGSKGPNIAGRDLFFVTYYSDGSIDEDGIPQVCKTEGKCNGASNAKDVRVNAGKNCKTNQDAKGCFGLILNDNWQMTY